MQIEIALIFFALIIWIDIKWHEIPDRLTFLGIILGLIVHILLQGVPGILESLAGIFIGGMVIIISGMLAITIWGKAGIGGGDVKLLIMIGSFFGPIIALSTYALYPLLASIYAFTFHKKNIPCAPFIITSCLIALRIIGGGH